MRFDLAVIGAGFGGLGCALRAAELGLRVVVLESLAYPGGCASTYRRGGTSYESGATLFSGLHEGGAFGALGVEVDWLDPVFHVRTPLASFAVPRERAAYVARWKELEPAHAEAIARFFDFQKAVADSLWSLFEDPDLLPPMSLRAFFTHVGRLPAYLRIAPWMGRPLADVLEAFGLGRARVLRAFLDSLCQITVQVPAGEAEAPFALAAIDYAFRGTGHVRGGAGQLARAFTSAIEKAGGEVRFASRVDRVVRGPDGFVAQGRRVDVQSARIASNLLPADTARVFGGYFGPLGALHEAVQSSWGAVMLYWVVRDDGLLESGPHHVDLTLDPDLAPTGGNHVFCSVGAARGGERSVTMSTHVSGRQYAQEGGAFAAAVQAAMRRTVAELYPALHAARLRELPASPRTFQRFVGRTGGLVGGIPRRVGFGNYETLGPTTFLPNAWLVGDSVFPGQSILATAVGGRKTAEALVRLA